MKKTFFTTLLAITTIAPLTHANATQSYQYAIDTRHAAASHTSLSQQSPFDLQKLLGDTHFFAIKDPKSGAISYTRSGSFLIMDGYFYQAGKRLQGYTLATERVTEACELSDIKLTSITPPLATSQIKMFINLNSDSIMPTVPFNSNDSASYNYQTAITIYDSLGNAHVAAFYFITEGANSWNIRALVDGTDSAIGHITFTTSGQFNNAEGLSSMSFSPVTGAAAPQIFSLSMSGSTQYDASSYIFEQNADGHTSGFLAGLDIDEIGYINQIYTNGEKMMTGRIAILK